MNFLSCVNDNIEHMATFTVLYIGEKLYHRIAISAIQRYLRLAKFLSSKNFQLYGNLTSTLAKQHLIQECIVYRHMEGLFQAESI